MPIHIEVLMNVNRRSFLKISAAIAGNVIVSTVAGCRAGSESAPKKVKSKERKIQTVRGRIKPSEFGFALVHEHILIDFIGADKISPDRYDAQDVFNVMLPKLMQARQRGITGFVECTPAYFGRDVRLLRRLADAADMHILTNTGYYGARNDKFVPTHAYTDSVDQLAGRWISEFEKGIDGTDIRPGFMKIGVDSISRLTSDVNYGLSDIDAKLVRAAARAHKHTGLPIAAHTGQGAAALAQLAIFEEEGIDLSAVIMVHADFEPDQSYDMTVTGRGAWLEFDGITPKPRGLGWPSKYYAERIKAASQYEDKILLSMDSGWYWVGKAGDWAGEVGGGIVRDYNYLPDVFLPALRKDGISEQMIHQLTVSNPANAFSID
jgi:predicted metal-dependent phosphotriesterase family hydrolase